MISVFLPLAIRLNSLMACCYRASLAGRNAKCLTITLRTVSSESRREQISLLPMACVPMPQNQLLKTSWLLQYTPAHYYRMRQGRKVYEDARFPTFTLGYERAFPLSGSLLSPCVSSDRTVCFTAA